MPALRVICAPDKLREALGAAEAASCLATGARAAGWDAIEHPLADGGEGTAEVVLARGGGELRRVDSVDALGRSGPAPFAVLPDGSALVVAADVIGLASLAAAERNPMHASSRGLAAPITAAIASGARRLIIFLGGTANMDGGIGLLSALGAEVRDRDGTQLAGTGADLARVASVDVAATRSRLAGVELIVASDVDSPLWGEHGAARVFGPQKGADAAAVESLDDGLRRLAGFLGPSADAVGAGAAGGLGAALLSLGGHRVAGAQLILTLTGFREQLAEVDLCLTAEGSVDASSKAGKVVSAVLAACADAGVPGVVLGGTVTAEADGLYELGAAGLFAIGRRPRSMPEALLATGGDLTATARAVCALAGAAGRPRSAVTPS